MYELNLQLVGDRIEDIIASYNMWTTDFLKQNDLPINLVDDIRNGIVPRTEVVYQFALYAGCSVDYLVGLKDEKWMFI